MPAYGSGGTHTTGDASDGFATYPHLTRGVFVNAPEYLPLPDTQSLPDARELPIERVGVKGLRYPLAIRAADGTVQHTIAEVGMY
ncbi:MAG TPA: GTP cyclohydrolase, FolE2/MptA family, partial [Actinomycetota bacterium]|nr:GTP cyclohydrolase, FolE2/MptA family [Actinomycetota bacterium]